MKMTPTPYTITARQVVFTPEAKIVATFKGGAVFAGTLGELKAWALENKVDRPLSCTTELGRHGLYPCIIATSRTLAAGLSVLQGTPIMEHDGATFSSRTQLKGVYRALTMAGIQIPEEALQWGITDQAYSNASKPVDQPKPTSEEALELQLADSPF